MKIYHTLLSIFKLYNLKVVAAFFLIFCLNQITFAQTEMLYEDHIYKNNIKTVLLHRDSSQLSYPIMELNEMNALNLRFDDLDGNTKSYSYSIILCNSDWTPSDQPQMWYTKGFFQGNINTVDFSFGTKPNFTNYYLRFPNEDLQPKLSGNYILKVFENYDPENIVLTKRFMVVEDVLKIQGKVRDAYDDVTHSAAQDVLFKINASQLPNIIPQRDLNVCIFQNFRWDNMKSKLNPAFMSANELDYYLIDGSNRFQGGNEYRYFDMRTINIRPDKVYLMKTENDTLNLYGRSELSRRYSQYSMVNDLNGNYLISTMDGRDPNLDGNYAKVHFALSYDKGIAGLGDLYMVGGISGNKLNEEWKMDFDYEKKEYFLVKYLKQGYYNFLFVRKDPAAKNASDAEFFEGSFSRTENNYIIMVYYRDLMQRNDRIVGFEIINSFRNR